MNNTDYLLTIAPQTIKKEPEAILTELLRAVGLRATGSVRKAATGDEPYFLWVGEIRNKAGMFFIPALFPSSAIPKAIAAVRRSRGEDIDGAIRHIARWHTGLSKHHVGLSPWAAVEIDHLPLAEQAAAYDRMTAATGIPLSLRVYSGGKSLHGIISYRKPLDAKDPRRELNQHLLIACLEGDTAIQDPGRLMRLPGYMGAGRQQPVVAFDPHALVDPEDMTNKLVSYARTMGIDDVAKAILSMRLAEELEKQAQKERSPQAATEIRDHARHLRATRGEPAEADMRLAKAMLPRAAVAACSTPVTVVMPGTTNKVKGNVSYISQAQMAAYDVVPISTVCDPPCCPGKAKGHQKGYKLSHGRIYCNKHAITYMVEPTLTSKTGIVTDARLDALLGPLPAVPLPPPGPDADDIEHEAQVASLAVYAERYAKKKQKAESMDPAMVEAATTAMALARDLHPGILARMRGQGLPLPDPTNLCGIAVGTQNAATGVLAAFRNTCGSLSCPSCGPVVVAQKTAAIIHMPVRQDGHVVGDPMGTRPTYSYRIPTTLLDTMDSVWSSSQPQVGAESKNRSSSNTVYNRSPIEEERFFDAEPTSNGREEQSEDNVDSWVRFTHGPRTVVLATRPLRFAAEVLVVDPLEGTRSRVPVEGVETEEVEVLFRGKPKAKTVVRGEVVSTAKQLRALVEELVAETYVVAPATTLEDANGVPIHMGAIVLGKISSSMGLCLDPAEVARIAAGSAWIGLGQVEAKALAAELKKRSIEHNDEVRADGDRHVSTRSFVEPSTAVEVLQDSGAELWWRPAAVPAGQNQAWSPPLDMSCILQDMDGL